MLSNEGRKGIASYLDIRRPGGPRRVAFGQTLHPSIQRVWAMVEETYNDTVLAQQDLLNSEKADAILESLPEELRAEVRNKWSDTANYASSQKRWEQLVTAVGKYRNSPKGKKTNLLETFVRDMILQCCFPRLDVHVTTAMNHLLKAPFCIHPRSRKICVPIATTEFDTFDPDKVPTDFLVLSELANNSGLGGSYTAERTSLWPYIQTFDSFVDTLLADQPSRLNVFLSFNLSPPPEFVLVLI
ncbi:p48 polypeptide of DNA primase [Massospora cicadina]|nr:p48 polypeptide of DNA primase [Massospora cicadina]